MSKFYYTVSHSRDELGFIVKKSWMNEGSTPATMKKFRSQPIKSHRRIWVIVSETWWNLINWRWMVSHRITWGRAFEFIWYKISMNCFFRPHPSFQPWYIVASDKIFNNCLAQAVARTTRLSNSRLMPDVSSDMNFSSSIVLLCWWKGKSIWQWREREEGSNFADFFFDLINLLLMDDYRHMSSTYNVCQPEQMNKFHLISSSPTSKPHRVHDQWMKIMFITCTTSDGNVPCWSSTVD